jgi:hypothetical protein
MFTHPVNHYYGSVSNLKTAWLGDSLARGQNLNRQIDSETRELTNSGIE